MLRFCSFYEERKGGNKRCVYPYKRFKHLSTTNVCKSKYYDSLWLIFSSWPQSSLQHLQFIVTGHHILIFQIHLLRFCLFCEYINMYHSSCDYVILRVFWAKCPSFCRWSQALPGKVNLFKDISNTISYFSHTSSWCISTSISTYIYTYITSLASASAYLYIICISISVSICTFHLISTSTNTPEPQISIESADPYLTSQQFRSENAKPWF